MSADWLHHVTNEHDDICGEHREQRRRRWNGAVFTGELRVVSFFNLMEAFKTFINKQFLRKKLMDTGMEHRPSIATGRRHKPKTSLANLNVLCKW